MGMAQGIQEIKNFECGIYCSKVISKNGYCSAIIRSICVILFVIVGDILNLSAKFGCCNS